MPLITATHDSLPYVDTPTPASLLTARALIASALPTSTPPLHPLLPPSPTLTPSPALEIEFTRLSSSSTTPPPLHAIDTTRYELPSSPSPNPTLLNQAYTSQTYLLRRSTTLSLLETYGKNAWLIHISQLESILAALEREYMATGEGVENVNRERRKVQEGRREELRALEGEWRGLVGRGVEVQMGLGSVERELGDVRRNMKGS